MFPQMLPPNAFGILSQPSINVFFSYAHEDDALRCTLEKHLSILKRKKVITTWYDRNIGVGQEWSDEIDAHLDSASIILLLISADFLASDYCYGVELNRAMERHQRGEASVIPIILRPVDWVDAQFSALQCLPTDAKPITTWANQDEAFTDVAKGIRNEVDRLLKNAEEKIATQISQLGAGEAKDAQDLLQQIASDASKQRTERWKIMQDLQQKLAATAFNVDASKLKKRDRAFEAMDTYIRSSDDDKGG